MNVEFKSLEISNFLSVGQINLDIQDGITSIIGKNLSDSYSESNGSGKSSLIEAIIWSLTGSTTRGISSDSVIHNQKVDEGCKVRITLDVDSDEYDIIRTRGGKLGNSITILKNGDNISGNTMKKSQGIIEELIPLNYEELTSCIILAQDMPGKLSSLSPAGRKSKLEKIANYDDEINSLTSILKSEKKNLESSGSSLKSEIDSIKIYTLPSLNKSLERETNEYEDFKIRLLNQELRFAQIDGENEVNRGKVKELEKVMLESREMNSDDQDKIMSIEEELKDLRQGLTPKEEELKDIESLILYRNGRILEHKKNLESLGTGICRACKRPLDNKEEIDKHRNEILDLIKIDEDILEGLESRKEIALRDKSVIDSMIDDKVAELKALDGKIKERWNEIWHNQRLVDDYLSRIVERPERIEDRSDYYESKIKGIQDEIGELEGKIKDLEPKYEENNNRLIHLNGIMTDISRGQFRNFLLSKTMSNFNALLAQISLELMKDEPVRLLFDGDRIEIMYKDKLYEQMSGGEKKRIDIAVELTVRKYKSLVSGVNFNLLIMDETFDSLDKFGIDCLFNAVEASGTTDSFMVISHREDACLNYDRRITVCKENNFSRIL